MAYTVRVDISRRLAEIADRVEELLDAFREYMRIGCQNVILPRLRDVVPVRTGQLRAARRFYPGRGTYVGGFGWDSSGFYWIFQEGLPEASQRVIDQLLPGVTEWAWQRARAKAGI